MPNEQRNERLVLEQTAWTGGMIFPFIRVWVGGSGGSLENLPAGRL